MRRGALGVTYLADGEEGPPRVAYAIGRRVGGAVVRNRLRRRLRAVVAAAAADDPRMPPGAYLFTATPVAVSLTHEELKSNVASLLNALGDRITR
ncbi:MAG: Ribonuclease protein component [Acidimicrobiales bacterium]|nr:Ribonuclease protein component [Acidimicrobiales bacterium]